MINKYRDFFFYLNRGVHTFVSYLSKYKITPKPSVMYLELTYRCTCKCGFCNRWQIGPKLAHHELTTKEVKRVLSEAYKIGVRYVGFTGGEAFLREDVFKIGQFAKDLGITATVASNGTLINKKNIDKIVRIFSYNLT
jgi:MoaA/NifB/PqqE/SkfB family radical SAM enzyme